MLSSRVLLDSGADFSCVSNDALLRMKESGINLCIQSNIGHSGGVSANGSPLKVVGQINLDIEFNLTSGEIVLVNWTFVVMDNLNSEFIIGMDVLRQIGFGVGRDSLWIGNQKTGKICSLKEADQEILNLRCKNTLGNETWCLYEVAGPIEKRLTSVADSNWSMSRADDSNNFRRFKDRRYIIPNREQECEMQALFLVNFPCGMEIPRRIARSRSKFTSPTLKDSKHDLI